MSKFILSTDATSDLPQDYVAKNDIVVLPMAVTLNDKTYTGKDGDLIDYKKMYAAMREGIPTSTSQVNIQDAKDIFEPFLKAGKDIVHVSLSSGLSGSYNSMRLLANDLMEEYPERKVLIIDSLGASLGEGFLVNFVNEQRKQGKSAQEAFDIAEKDKKNVCLYFTVSDLKHLHRGGRVTKGVAIIGTLLHIKPLLYVNDEGHLIPIQKCMGRKKSLVNLVDKMADKSAGIKNDIVFIGHGDCEEEAKYVADLMKQRFGIQNFLIAPIGAVIGAHSGPGTIAIFFWGKDRKE